MSFVLKRNFINVRLQLQFTGVICYHGEGWPNLSGFVYLLTLSYITLSYVTHILQGQGRSRRARTHLRSLLHSGRRQE